MKQILLNGQDDCQWLKETHLKNKDYPEFKCFILCGNEDAPEKVELYSNKERLIKDVPTVVMFD